MSLKVAARDVLILPPTESNSDLEANDAAVGYKRRHFQQLLDASKPSLTKEGIYPAIGW